MRTTALDSLGVTLEDARSRVEHKLGRDVGREEIEPSPTGQLPFTPRIKEVLTQAASEARWLEHDGHLGPSTCCWASPGNTRAWQRRCQKNKGRRVSVAVEDTGSGEPGRFKCTLDGADDRGIVVSSESGTKTMTRFYPWHAVAYIDLASSGEPKQPPRRAGFTPA